MPDGPIVDQRSDFGLAWLTANYGDALGRIGVAIVRDYVRNEMLPQVLQRLYSIGMGVEQFDFVTFDSKTTKAGVTTKTARVIQVAAPAAVQVKALDKLASIATPSSAATGDSAPKMPGIFALPELDLEAAREQAGRGGIMGLPAPTNGNGNGAKGVGDLKLSPDVLAAVDAGEMEIVEVDEKVTPVGVIDDEPPPPVQSAAERQTPEQLILAKRRAKKNGGNNGR